MCDFTLLSFSNPIYAFLSKSMLQVKCLECKRNSEFHSLNASLLIKDSFFAFYKKARVFKARINYYSNDPCRVKEVAGLKKQAEIYPGKCPSHTPNLSRFSNSS